MKAKDIMVTNVITVSPEASVRQVANMSIAKWNSALPVVNDHGQLVGIIERGGFGAKIRAERVNTAARGG